ncbi:MAG: hypothetical protein WBK77_09445 [Alphaproteobacteria bacterium]
MAGPLNGIGQTQIPLATTFQPGRSSDTSVRERDTSSRGSEEVGAKEATSSRTEDTRSRTPENLQSLLKDAESTTKSDRGNVVDVTV